MLALPITIIVAWVSLRRGPALLVDVIVTATAFAYARRAASLDEQMWSYRGQSLRRLRDGFGWHRDRTGQLLLARSLRLALKRVELFSCYPTSATRGTLMAGRIARRRANQMCGNSLA